MQVNIYAPGSVLGVFYCDVRHMGGSGRVKNGVGFYATEGATIPVADFFVCVLLGHGYLFLGCCFAGEGRHKIVILHPL